MPADNLSILLRLLPWLVAHPGVSAHDIASEFGITPARAMDLVRLLTMTGPGQGGGELIDIQYDDDGEYISVVEAQGFDRPLNVDSRQASALLAGLSYLREMPAVVDSAQVEALVAKLTRALHPVAALEVVAPDVERECVALLKSAIQDGVCVDIVYASGTANVTSVRRIEPKALDVQDDRTYVRAWCRVAQGQRSFRVDRIVSAEATTDPAVAAISPTDFAIERTHWHDAVLDVTREHLGDFDRETVVAVTDMGDRLRLEVKVATLEWLATAVLAAGGGITVVEPAAVRDLVAANVAAFRARNAG